MEAASVGAMGAIKLIANVIVNLVAFIALLSFLDATLSYFGSRVGYPELSFDVRHTFIWQQYTHTHAPTHEHIPVYPCQNNTDLSHCKLKVP